MRHYTAAEVDAILRTKVPTFVGDSGSGGKEGLVPPPPINSSLTNMFLGAGGDWKVVTGGGAISGSPVGLNVKDYGATGDGTTDDTDYIQLAIDSANAAGGGVVYFPKGVYRIRVAKTADSQWRHCLTIYKNIVICGASKENSIIKLIDNAGNYVSIFARSANGLTDTNDFGMYNITIDQNTTNNHPATLSDLTSYGYRMILIYYGGRRCTVSNCVFKDCKNINTLAFNAPYGLCGDIEVSGCRFVMATSASINNDHSSIYTSADNVVIRGNQFISPTMANYGARTAVEIHGDRNNVYGNVVKNFYTGMNVTGVAEHSNGVTVENNIIEGCRSGIVLWSWFAGGNVDQPALVNCTINNNSIIVDRDGWSGYPGVPYAAGIFTESTGTAPIVNLKITDNIVTFTPTTTGIVQDNLSNGISILRTNIEGQGFDENIVISGNTIKNAIGCGIDMRTSCKRLVVTDNLITNPGQTKYPLANSFFSGVLVFPTGPKVQDNWTIARNIIVDDQDTPTMLQAVSISNVPCNDCRIEDNIWKTYNRVLGTHRAMVGTSTTSAAWYQKWAGSGITPTNDFVGNVLPGSTINNYETGTLYTQVTAPQGGTYVAAQATSYAAYRIPFGDPSSNGALSSSDEATFIESVGSASLLVGAGTDKSSDLILRKGDNSTGSLSFWKHNVKRAQLFFSIDDANLVLTTYNTSGGFNDSVLTIPVSTADVSINRNVRLATGSLRAANIINDAMGGADRIPVADSSNSLIGNANLRYLSGNLIVGSSSLAGFFYSNGPVSGVHGLIVSSNGSQRFNIQSNGTESGSDAGKNIAFNVYNDSGTFIDTPLLINRRSGVPIEFRRPLALNGGISPSVLSFTASTTASNYTGIYVYTNSSTGSSANVIAPPAGVIGSGRSWTQTIKNDGAGILTYSPSGSDTINGITDPVKIWPGETLSVFSNGVSRLHYDPGFSSKTVTSCLTNVNIGTTGDVGIFTRLPSKHIVESVIIWSTNGAASGATVSLNASPSGVNSISTMSLSQISGANTYMITQLNSGNFRSSTNLYLYVNNSADANINVMVKALNVNI